MEETKFTTLKTYEFARRRYVLSKAINDDIYRLSVFRSDKPGYGVWTKTQDLIQSNQKIKETLASEKLECPPPLA